MINRIEPVLARGIVFKYQIDGVPYCIRFDDLLPYWEYANEDCVESAHAHVEGHYIIGILLTSSSQGGIIFIWDPILKRVAHISDGSYAVAVSMNNDDVYSLCDVQCWGTQSHFELFKCSFGMLNTWKLPDKVECKISCDSLDFKGDFDAIKLFVDQDEITIMLYGESFPVSIL